MLLNQSRQILRHTGPMLIAQLASMGMMAIDTVLLGHYGTEDLAAVAVGGGVYVAVVFALSGILQAVSPTVAQLKGAGRYDDIGDALQQGFWLAALLSVPGIAFLHHPDALLSLSAIEPAIDAKARAYLAVLAWGIPAVLFYRTFYAFSNALGEPRPLMLISLGGTVLHGGLAALLVNGAGWGVLGCGVSNALVGWFALVCGALYIVRSRALKPYRIARKLRPPCLKSLRELVRLGAPMGFSNFIEISSFSLTALFVAQMGAEAVAGHRIVANLAAICYMLPLSLGIATLSQVGQAAGARDWPRARLSALSGVVLASGLSLLLGGALWLAEAPLVRAYTVDPAVRQVALSLVIYVVLYQVFDAIQTLAAFALRAYKVTFSPMLVHLVCFWGVALFGGWWLAFRGAQPMGVAGFWVASLVSLVLAALLLGALLWRAMTATSRSLSAEQPV